jgi:rSAM/selenodomain-associated transferase 2
MSPSPQLSASPSASLASFASLDSLDSLSIVIPVYRDDAALTQLLAQLRSAREAGAEIIVAGTTNDASSETIAKRAADRYVAVERCRGAQLVAGTAASSRELLWFLHADTKLAHDAPRLVCEALALHTWGRFNIAFDDASPLLRVVAMMMNWRSRASGIATGDQGIFVRRSAYNAVGGFQSIPLMEDIALSRALRESGTGGTPACIRTPLVTSARKWKREGIVKTIVRMWMWRFRYWRGASPEVLAREYYRDLA